MNKNLKNNSKPIEERREPVTSLRLKAQRYDVLVRDLRELIRKYETLLQLTKENT